MCPRGRTQACLPACRGATLCPHCGPATVLPGSLPPAAPASTSAGCCYAHVQSRLPTCPPHHTSPPPTHLQPVPPQVAEPPWLLHPQFSQHSQHRRRRPSAVQLAPPLRLLAPGPGPAAPALLRGLRRLAGAGAGDWPRTGIAGGGTLLALLLLLQQQGCQGVDALWGGGGRSGSGSKEGRRGAQGSGGARRHQPASVSHPRMVMHTMAASRRLVMHGGAFLGGARAGQGRGNRGKRTGADAATPRFLILSRWQLASHATLKRCLGLAKDMDLNFSGRCRCRSRAPPPFWPCPTSLLRQTSVPTWWSAVVCSKLAYLVVRRLLLQGRDFHDPLDDGTRLVLQK